MSLLAFGKAEIAASNMNLPLALGEHLPPVAIAFAGAAKRRHDVRCSVSDLIELCRRVLRFINHMASTFNLAHSFKISLRPSGP